MAKWRAIYGSITTDEAIIELSDPDQLLYERMVVKADDWGIITGNIKSLKIETIPVSSRNFQEIEESLRQMQELSLIWRYQPNGCGPLIQIRKFDEHQPGELIRKRTDPKLPLHPDWRPINGDTRGSKILQEMAGLSEKFLPRVEESRVEENITTTTTPTLSSIWINKTTQMIGAVAAEKIDDLEEDYPRDWIVDAIDEACLSSKGPPTVKYLMAILARWKREGKGSKPHGKSSRRDLSPEQIAQRAEFDRVAQERQRERDG